MGLDAAALTLVEDTGDIADFLRWLGERRPVLGADTETTGLDYIRDTLRLVQFGDVNAGWAIPWHLWAGLVHEVFGRYEGRIVFHNGAFDVPMLLQAGVPITWRQLEDTLIMAHLVDPPGIHGLKPMSVALIDPRADDGQVALKEGMRANKWTWATVPHDYEPYWVYSALDPVLTSLLYEKLQPKVRAQCPDLYELELVVQRVMLQARMRGAAIDVPYAQAEHERLGVRAAELVEQVQRDWGIRPSSTQELADRLVADGVTLTKRTPKGDKWSMDKEVFEGLENVGHPLARLVLDWRKATRFRKAYFEAVLGAVDGDGLLHPQINTLGARTGRMSVSSPPLQQIPSHEASVRQMFVPRRGNALLSVDFSNIEARVMAHFSQDPFMMRAFREGEDVHLAMARAMYPELAGLPADDPRVVHARKNSKSGTFGKLYGAGPKKFAVQQGVSVDEARAFFDFYDETFPGVKAFIDTVQATGEHRYRTTGHGYVESPSGRRHTLTKWEEKDRAFYKLTNYICQGTAADILKQRIADLDAAGFADVLVLPVHDELLWDVPAEDVDDYGRAVVELMQDLHGWSVPITVDAEVYEQHWGQCLDGKRDLR